MIKLIGVPKDEPKATVFALVDFQPDWQQQMFLTTRDLKKVYKLIGAKLKEKGIILKGGESV